MNDEQLLRYSRQILLPGFDIEGQERLISSKVLLVGLGGLGCPVALYLAAAGVGEIWLADYDAVELSNLQRQILHTREDIGRPKVISAREALAAINPEVRTLCISERLEGNFLEDAVSGVDLVVDASDNIETRFAVNAACVKMGRPLVSGAAIRAEGQVVSFNSTLPDSPCYQCLYCDGEEVALNCSESGVISPLVGVIGSIQALEAIKILSNFGEVNYGQLTVFDGSVGNWSQISIPRRASCEVCRSENRNGASESG